MVVAFSGGGTLGHVYPTIPVINYLKKTYQDIKIIYLASCKDQKYHILTENNQIDQLYFFDIIGFSKGLKNINTIGKLLKGIKKIKETLVLEKVELVVGMGGYISGASLYVAKQLNIKTILHEQNSIIGTANKWMLTKVDWITSAFPLEFKKQKLQKKYFLVGNPREDVARAYPPSLFRTKKNILITSGTLGSQVINNIACEFLNSDKSHRYSTVLVTGRRYYEEVLKKVKPGKHYQIVPFSENLLEELSKAGVVISRSGATTSFEILGSGAYPIFIPSPNVTKNHQLLNASYFEKRGIGIIIEEKDLNFNLLWSHLEYLDGNYENYLEKRQVINENNATVFLSNIIINHLRGGII